MTVYQLKQGLHQIEIIMGARIPDKMVHSPAT